MNVKRTWDEFDLKNRERIKKELIKIAQSKETFCAADLPSELKKDMRYYFGGEIKLIEKLKITNYEKAKNGNGKVYADDHDLSAGIDLTETLMQTNPEFFRTNGEINIPSKCWDCALAVTVPERQCAWIKHKVMPKGVEFYTSNKKRSHKTHPPTYTVIKCKHFMPDGAFDAENKKYRAHNMATDENYEILRQAVLGKIVQDYIAVSELNMADHKRRMARYEEEILAISNEEFLARLKYKIKKEREKNEQGDYCWKSL